jgi:hypothetical protein
MLHVLIIAILAAALNWCGPGPAIPDYCMSFEAMPLDKDGRPLCESPD